MTDLFEKRSAKERLFDWMRDRMYTKTSEVIRWGTQNFSNRADRNARALAAEGKIRRLSDSEKDNLFGRTKEDIWVVNA